LAQRFWGRLPSFQQGGAGLVQDHQFPWVHASELLQELLCRNCFELNSTATSTVLHAWVQVVGIIPCLTIPGSTQMAGCNPEENRFRVVVGNLSAAPVSDAVRPPVLRTAIGRVFGGIQGSFECRGASMTGDFLCTTSAWLVWLMCGAACATNSSLQSASQQQEPQLPSTACQYGKVDTHARCLQL
jgi:hypothetical protein